MIKEIETREIIPETDMIETFRTVCKRYGFTVNNSNLEADTKYARVTICRKFESMGDNAINYKVWAECGIRFMGDLTIDEMQDAANDIKAATVIAQYINIRLENILVAQ